MMRGPALALLELDSVARGVVVLDAMVKKAEVEVREARSVSPGRYLVRVHGGVGEVDEALQAGLAAAGDALLDHVFLPNPHEVLEPLLAGEKREADFDAVGLVECFTTASALKAVDAAAKAAEIEVTRLEVANQLGGKAWFLLTGDQHMVEAALDAAAHAVTGGMLRTVEMIARPHADTAKAF